MFFLAWKNILFYRGRSSTTFVLTFISTLLFILYVSMMDGMHKSMLVNTLKIYTGSIEIYHKGYRDIGGNEYLIQDVKKITQKLSEVEGIDAWSSRFETFALLAYKEYSVASMVVGIDPEKEKQVSSVALALKEGSYLDKDSANCLYMGSVLVKKLHLEVGDELAFIGSASDNSFAADILKLCGVFQTGLFEFDSSVSFVNRRYFDLLMDAKNKASYITVKVKNLDTVDLVNQNISKVLDDKNLESLTWKVLMKTMVEAMEVDSIFGYISLALFLVVIFFVIMIYGFINISSRIKEFGVLRCIGLSRRNIFWLLLYEILILSSLAILLATPIATYICYYFSVHPIVVEGMAKLYKEYGVVSNEIPLNFDLLSIAWNVGVVYLLNILSIVYPYFYINSFKPIEASKHV